MALRPGRIFLLATVLACSERSTPARPDAQPPPTKTSLFFVAPSGSDDNPGTRDRPFATIGRGVAEQDAEELFIAAGTYEESEVLVERTLKLVAPGEESARLVGALMIGEAARVEVHGLDVDGRVVISNADGLLFEQAKVIGRMEHSVEVSGTTGSFRELSIQCAASSCMDVESSTISLSKIALEEHAERPSMRGLHLRSSTVIGDEVSVEGTRDFQIQASNRSQLELKGGQLTKGRTALAALSGSRVTAEGLTMTPNERGLLTSQATATLKRSSIGPVSASGVAVQGSEVLLEDVILEKAPFASIAVTNHNAQAAEVTVKGGIVRHGEYVGLSLDQGRVVVDGTRFIGTHAPEKENGEAILAASALAQLKVESATIETPNGVGIGIYRDAEADVVSATIESPLVGGVLVEDTAAQSVILRALRIRDCKTGSGITVLGASDVLIDNAEVERCAESGILTGLGSEVVAKNNILTDNTLYGLGAFGGSVVQVSYTTVSGSQWAVFATCGEGSRIEDVTGNRFNGPTTECP